MSFCARNVYLDAISSQLTSHACSESTACPDVYVSMIRLLGALNYTYLCITV